MLKPLLSITGNLANAVGVPYFTTRARAIQTVLFVPGVILGALLGGTNGVAISVDLVMIIGLGALLLQVRAFIDISLSRLFRAPLLALAAGTIVGWYGQRILIHMHISPWGMAGIIGGGFIITYTIILFGLEYKEYIEYAKIVTRLLATKG